MAVTPYSHLPDHPLYAVPQEVLDVARRPVRDAAEYHDVEPSEADSIADAVVAQLAEHGYLARREPTDDVALNADATDDRTPHRVAIVVFAEVDAVDQVDADHVVRFALRRALARAANRVNPGGAQTVIRHTPRSGGEHWDVTIGELVALQNALGAYHGYTRFTVNDRAFPHRNWENNL